MFLPLQAYTIIDLTHKGQELAVVVEATSRKEVSDYLKAHGLAECDVFKEHDEEIYRGVCPVTIVTSSPSTEETGRGE